MKNSVQVIESPGPSMLNGMKQDRFSWAGALGELIDNSFDANADRVVVTFSRKRVEVQDDGAGCDDPLQMLTIGKHMPKRTTSLGRYGVGLKSAAVWLWGKMQIKTTSGGKTRILRVNWDVLCKQKDWTIDATRVQESQHVNSGTLLTFDGHRRDSPNYEKLRNEIGYIFAPAMWQGKQIVIAGPTKKSNSGGVTCAPWNVPDLEEVVSESFDVNGKSVQLKVGIVPEGQPNERPGFSYAYGHRIIMLTSLGAGDYSVSRICGTVWLGSGWELGKHKSELTDEDSEALAEAVFARCEAMLIIAGKQADVIVNRMFESVVTGKMRNLLRDNKKAKRNGKQNATGTVSPKKTGKRHRKARVSQAGATFAEQCKPGSIKMEWIEMEESVLGEVDLPGQTVRMNPKHARLKEHRNNENHDAIVDLCLMMLTHEVLSNRDDQPEFNFMSSSFDDFLSGVSMLLGSQSGGESKESN